jgi:hypothetical protein
LFVKACSVKTINALFTEFKMKTKKNNNNFKFKKLQLDLYAGVA